MSASQLLRHLHLPSIAPFSRAQNLQSALVSQLLSYKAAISSPSPPSTLSAAPIPTLLTFSPTPVYTTGRRELGTLTPSQIAALKEPLRNIQPEHDPKLNVASVEETLRGGQITFHGPGQLVIYPILDLKGIHSSVWPKGLTARCYVNLLEETTIKTLAHFGVLGKRTENPGVWVDDDTKIAALGVHLRRNITSYGVGLNLSTELRWFDRIVACGLEGKKTTSMKAQGVDFEARSYEARDSMSMEVATIWASNFTRGLWGDGGRVDRIQDVEQTEEQVLGKGLV